MTNFNGANANEILNSAISNYLIKGFGGNDFVFNNQSDDALYGNFGRYTFNGYPIITKNIFLGGSGNDFLNITASNENNILVGGSGDDSLDASASTGKNILIGGSGNDNLNITASSGNNALSGDAGNDTLDISYSTGNNTVLGGSGDDYFYAYEVQGSNIFNGGDRNDSFYFSTASTSLDFLVTQTIDGGTGNDYLFIDYYYANEGITTTYNATTNRGLIIADNYQVSYKNIEQLAVIGTVYDDYLVGSNGNDTLIGGDSGDDTIIGGAGDDDLSVDYSTGQNLLDGGDGNDYLFASTYYVLYDHSYNDGASGNNTLNGGNGNDFLIVDYSTGNNLLDGGNNNDYLSAYAASGNNTLNGGVGNDSLSVEYSTGDNLLNGGDGDDYLILSYSLGNNILNGDAGNDTLDISNSIDNNQVSGGTGNDFFYAYEVQGRNTLNGGDDDDFFYLSALSTPASFLVTQTIDGGTGNDYLYLDYSNGNGRITTTFNATTTQGSMRAGTNQVSYKNIEELLVIGTAYNDNFIASNGNNTLIGGSGADSFSVNSSTGNNLLDGGDDNDSFNLSVPSTSLDSLVTQTVDGGTGNDYLSLNYKYANEGITTTFDATTNQGLMRAGNYQVSYQNIEQLNISGTAYSDYLVGGNGNDTLIGGSNGNDTIFGGAGNDYLSPNSTGNCLLDGGDGNDYLYVYDASSNNTLIGGAGDDWLGAYSSTGNNLLDGGDGNDFFYFNIPYTAPSSLVTETVDGGTGDDYLTLYYYDAEEGITATFDPTTNTGSIATGNYQVSYKNIEELEVTGTAYDDYIVGSNGNDTLTGGDSGNDTIFGGAGNDSLTVDSWDNNFLDGGDGNDYLYISNSFGNNTLTGGNGDDTLIGGYGTNTFVFNSYDEGLDTLYNFDTSNGVIQVSAAGFGGGLLTGSLFASQFTLGTTATTDTQRFIYDYATGALYFDLDGSAGGFSQVQFAQLDAEMSLTESNFLVV